MAFHLLEDLKQCRQGETQSVKKHSNNHVSLTLIELLHFQVKQNFNLDLFCKWKGNGIFNGSVKILMTVLHIGSLYRGTTTSATNCTEAIF